MKALKIFITLIILPLIISCQTSAKKIAIKLFAPNLADSSKVFISGDIDSLGSWQPNKSKMTYAGNHIWIKEFVSQPNASVEYKFTLSSWQKEGLDKEGNPFPNFSINTAKTTSKTDTIYKWGQHINKVVGQITGTVKYHKQMHGDDILDRDVIVWLPPDYNEDSNTKYGVIYMHDGQNLFDPKTSAFGIDWQIDETCDKLIRAGDIKPVIVVGIYNTTDRNLDYSPGKKGNAYMNFIIKDLKPFIDKTYRTLPDRENTVIGGSSMGGLISMMLVWEHPEVFSKAICMSPAFKIDKYDYVKTVQNYKGPKKDIKIYIDCGGVGLESQLKPGIEDMINALEQKDYLGYKDYLYIYEVYAKHNESAWDSRYPLALNFIYN